MIDPYQKLPGNIQWFSLLFLMLATCLVAYHLGKSGAHLVTQKTPYGIVSIEMPWSVERASEVVASWRPEHIQIAKNQVMLDFLFLFLYPVTLSLVSAIIASHSPEKLAKTGVIASWAILLAIPLDMVENVAILSMLSGALASPIPQVTTISAALKFSLVLVTIGYVFVGGISAMVKFYRRATIA